MDAHGRVITFSLPFLKKQIVNTILVTGNDYICLHGTARTHKFPESVEDNTATGIPTTKQRRRGPGRGGM